MSSRRGPEMKASLRNMKLRCKNCGISILINSSATIVIIDGVATLSRSRCFCDEEHGILQLEDDIDSTNRS